MCPSEHPDESGECVETTIASLATKIEAFAEHLSERDQRVLQHMLYWAMDPIDRVALSAPDDVLDEKELETLRSLEHRGR